jgi:hypothetical protein
MTQDIIDTIANLLREHDEKPFGTVGEIIASKLTSLGWTSPIEREAIRAAALNEAAKHIYNNFQDPIVYLASDAILALATMPPEYVVVKPNEVLKNLAVISGSIGYLKGSQPQDIKEAAQGMAAVQAIVELVKATP